MPVIVVGCRVQVVDSSDYTDYVGTVISEVSDNVFNVNLDDWPSGRTYTFAAYQLVWLADPPDPPPPEPDGDGVPSGKCRMQLSGAAAAARSLTLSETPPDPALVTMSVRGLVRQYSGPDFTVVGRVLSWDDPDLGCYALLLEGDLILVEY